MLFNYVHLQRVERVVNELFEGIEIYKELQESLFVKLNFGPVQEKEINIGVYYVDTRNY